MYFFVDFQDFGQKSIGDDRPVKRVSDSLSRAEEGQALWEINGVHR